VKSNLCYNLLKWFAKTYEKMQYDNLQITRGMILDYAQECYNDSIHIEYGIWNMECK
jgi:hypothetical protein